MEYIGYSETRDLRVFITDNAPEDMRDGYLATLNKLNNNSDEGHKLNGLLDNYRAVLKDYTTKA